MKRVMAAAMLVLAAGLPAKADEKAKSTAIENIGVILALEKLCPRVEASHVKLAYVAQTVGIELNADGPDGKALQAEIRRQVRTLSSGSEDSICEVALFYFGDDGIKVPGLMHEK